jgi:MFS family permease
MLTSRVALTTSRASYHSRAGLSATRFLFSTSGTPTTDDKPQTKEPEQSWFMKKFGPHTCRADKDSKISRWAMIAPAFATHMCIGSPYGWSSISGTLAREVGFVSAAAEDWSFSEVAFPLSLVFALQGIAAAIGGKWQMKVGPRIAMMTAAACFGGGLSVAALGVHLHSLPMLYLGYGILAGTGVGIGYTPPVASLMEWFPDKRGLASGLCIAGFGSGALVFAPLVSKLTEAFAKMPTYVGKLGEIKPISKDGKLFAQVDGNLIEVVKANAADLAKLPYDLAEGYYAVGTGSTGAAPTLLICGGLYFATMLASSLAIRRPHEGYVVSSPAPASKDVSKPAPTSVAPVLSGNVSVDNAMKAPQFYLLFATFVCISSGGVGLFSVAKPMMSEVFSGAFPTLVTASFASTYLMLLSSANLGGRLAWASISDMIGRRNTFFITTSISIPLYLSIPYLVNSVITTHSEVPLYMFVGSTFAAITCMGATYAILPAYESDLFGSKYVGAIHGRMLLASTTGSLGGPSLLLMLRGSSERAAIDSLLKKVDPSKFQDTFGVPINQAEQLISAKQVTIAKLMDIAPSGVTDPTPYIYDSTMYAMSGLMVLATISHALVRPVKKELFENYEKPIIIDSPVEKK